MGGRFFNMDGDLDHFWHVPNEYVPNLLQMLQRNATKIDKETYRDMSPLEDMAKDVKSRMEEIMTFFIDNYGKDIEKAIKKGPGKKWT